MNLEQYLVTRYVIRDYIFVFNLLITTTYIWSNRSQDAISLGSSLRKKAFWGRRPRPALLAKLLAPRLEGEVAPEEFRLWRRLPCFSFSAFSKGASFDRVIIISSWHGLTSEQVIFAIPLEWLSSGSRTYFLECWKDTITTIPVINIQLLQL